MMEQYISDENKENYSDNDSSLGNNHENEMKRRLFENLKKAGVLDGMKSTMRVRLYEQLRSQGGPKKTAQDKGAISNQLSFKLAASLVADLMQKCDMPYALSVFLPESNLKQEVLSKSELLEVLGLNKDELFTSKPEMTPLLLDLVDIIKANKSIRPNKISTSIQTEEIGESAMSLEQKLKKIDHTFMDKSETERLIPFKSLEERMLKYKREVDHKAKEDLESEIRRLKEFEMSKMRIEEAQKYRLKIQEYRDELE